MPLHSCLRPDASSQNRRHHTNRKHSQRDGCSEVTEVSPVTGGPDNQSVVVVVGGTKPEASLSQI